MRIRTSDKEKFPSVRKRQQEQHPASRSPAFYNVLEKLRSGKPLNAKEKQIHDQGLLTRLVALNHERAAGEKRGLIRWLRPDYQNPTIYPATVTGRRYKPISQARKLLNIQNPKSLPTWPEKLPEQVALIRKLIGNNDNKVATPDAETLSSQFGRKNKKRSEQIEGILETLKGLGQL